MILFLAGTSDARALALTIKEAGYNILTTVVTENAGKEMQKVGLDVYVGRLTNQDFTKLSKIKALTLLLMLVILLLKKQVKMLFQVHRKQTFRIFGMSVNHKRFTNLVSQWLKTMKRPLKLPPKRRVSSC